MGEESSDDPGCLVSEVGVGVRLNRKKRDADSDMTMTAPHLLSMNARPDEPSTRAPHHPKGMKAPTN